MKSRKNRIKLDGRKNHTRDNTKLQIARYLYSKRNGSNASAYELIHHALSCMHDYIKKILQEMK